MLIHPWLRHRALRFRKSDTSSKASVLFAHVWCISVLSEHALNIACVMEIVNCVVEIQHSINSLTINMYNVICIYVHHGIKHVNAYSKFLHVLPTNGGHFLSFGVQDGRSVSHPVWVACLFLTVWLRIVCKHCKQWIQFKWSLCPIFQQVKQDLMTYFDIIVDPIFGTFSGVEKFNQFEIGNKYLVDKVEDLEKRRTANLRIAQ